MTSEYVIAAPVVAGVAARAAAGTAGVVRLEPGLRGLAAALVRAARDRWTGLAAAPAEGVRVRTADGKLTVEVDVVVSGIDQAAAVGQAVQRSVRREVAAQTGRTVDAVQVSIVDIEMEAR